MAALAIAWCANLYNFMDGIDGLAATEAVVVGGAGGLLLLRAGAPDLALIALLSAAASTGFLVWNWPPAQIFMGDAGSGLLGFLFGALAVVSVKRGVLSPSVWLLLLGVFLFDATATLVRRFLAGERWYSAHRLHAYQRAVQSGLSHRTVTGSVLALNCALASLAVLVALHPEWTLASLAVATALLLGSYLTVEHRRPMFSGPSASN
jgi:Fuc2NAc and GlcNAc transferase